MRGVESHLKDLEASGVKPIAISVDPPEASRKLRASAHYSFTFLSDAKAEVIRRYDLLHEGGGPGALDISRPAEFLIDSTGTVRWVNLTSDVRVRARPEEMLQAAKAIH